MQIGERVEIEVTLAGISHYNVKDRFGETDNTTTLWRHSFRDANASLYVYTGVRLGLQTGERVRLRGTVKRMEGAFGTRLARIKLIARNVPCPML